MGNSRPSYRARAITAVLTAGVLVAGGGLCSRAHAEGIPKGRFGLAGGVKQGFGTLGGDFGIGGQWGVQAGYNSTFGPLAWGVIWSVSWGAFAPTDDTTDNRSLRFLEMTAGVRLRKRLGRPARYLVVSSGIVALRTNIPVGDDDTRMYTGPFAGVGVEQYISLERICSKMCLVGLDWTYGLVLGGPRSLSAVLSFSFGI